MKAAVFEHYGPPEVIELREVPKPSPSDDEVLIHVFATTATPPDCLMRSGTSWMGRILLGFIRPGKKYRIPGIELAGEIEAVGRNVRRFKPGDQVYGFRGFGTGACAEYKCMSEKGSLALKPANLSYAEAAAIVDGTTTALFFLKDKANLQPGEKVLINGASGSMGTMAVQLAKIFGAEVIGVCSTSKVELVKSLGADKVIDYTRQDFTQTGDTYDIIFDVASKSSFAKCKSSLKPKGRYLVTNMSLAAYLQTLWTRILGGKKVIFDLSIEKNEALNFLKGLFETGQIRPVIDRVYPLEQIVEAHRYIATGRKQGSVVITMANTNQKQGELP